MTYRRDLGDGARSISLAAILGILAVVALAVVLLVGTFAFGWFRSTTADFRGGVDARDRTVGSGQYRIAQYDQFFSLCNQVIAQEGQIDDATSNVAGLPPQIASTNLAAAVQTRRDLVAEYNSGAQRTGTAGQFRDSTLPFQLPTTYTANGTKTTCAA